VPGLIQPLAIGDVDNRGIQYNEAIKETIRRPVMNIRDLRNYAVYIGIALIISIAVTLITTRVIPAPNNLTTGQDNAKTVLRGEGIPAETHGYYTVYYDECYREYADELMCANLAAEYAMR
jgi:hypothetical protein